MAGMLPAHIFQRFPPQIKAPSLLHRPIQNPSFIILLLPKSNMSSSLKIAASNLDVNGSSVQQDPHVLKIKKISENAVLPSRASPFSAGYDLSSAVATRVPARGKALVPTDLSISIPEGTYARIAPRSGLAWKYSIDVGAGVIDADYRGPVGVILINHSDVDFEVKAGDRIAQMIIERIMTPDVIEVDDLDATVRGVGGSARLGWV